MQVKELGRRPKDSGNCDCGKEVMIHTTEYIDQFTCKHLYMCNDCWWKYEKTPREMQPWQIATKQKDIEAWRNRLGYK